MLKVDIQVTPFQTTLIPLQLARDPSFSTPVLAHSAKTTISNAVMPQNCTTLRLTKEKCPQEESNL
jgi:hypothetical protein